MNKKKREVKPTNLRIKKETVAHLTTDMLKHVVGGAIPLTRITQCDTFCC